MLDLITRDSSGDNVAVLSRLFSSSFAKCPGNVTAWRKVYPKMGISEFHWQRRVEFAETDCAGIVHFATIPRYVEEAIHAFLRSLAFPVYRLGGESAIGFPRLAFHCEYKMPAHFEDLLDIHLWISHKGKRSLQYSALISRQDKEVARMTLNVACCEVIPGRSLRAIPLPKDLEEKIEEASYPALEFRDPDRRT